MNAVWLRDGIEIDTTTYKSVNDIRFIVTDFQIPSAKLEDEGFYQCALKTGGNITFLSTSRELKLNGK